MRGSFIPSCCRQRKNLSSVILGPVPRIRCRLIFDAWLDPRHKAEDGVAWGEDSRQSHRAAQLAPRRNMVFICGTENSLA
ncbi:hypothetical protein CFBP6623_23100 [Agrobacterium tumefaciens]|nr:hypothetical protein CFBP6623_23100 [Agrobacterium tumefaciens]